MIENIELSHLIVDALEDLKALEIRIIDVRGQTSVTDWLVIASGTSSRHVKSLASHVVDEMKKKYGIDGVMIGRAAIGYPWIFNEINSYLKNKETISKPTIEDRVRVCKRHLKHSIAWKGERRGIFETRRHYTNYFRGIPHFKDHRIKLVSSENPSEIIEILESIKDKFSEFSFS